MASAAPPALVIFATTVSRASLRRPETTTVQPSAASASAPASPIPLPPPVTQATRFPFLVMQTVSVASSGRFLLIQPSVLTGLVRRDLWSSLAVEEILHEPSCQRQSVFPPVRRSGRSEAPRDRDARRRPHQLWRSDRPGRTDGQCA